MRLVFSLIGLLIVVAIVLLVARHQLAATAQLAGAPAAVDAAGKPLAPAEASRQIQRNVADDVQKALQQGAAATASAVE